MAKKVGQVNENTGKVEVSKPRKAKEVDFPVTVLDTAWKRFKRNAVG